MNTTSYDAFGIHMCMCIEYKCLLVYWVQMYIEYECVLKAKVYWLWMFIVYWLQMSIEYECVFNINMYWIRMNSKHECILSTYVYWIQIYMVCIFLSFTFRLDTGFEVRRSISGVMRAQNGIYMFVDKREHWKRIEFLQSEEILRSKLEHFPMCIKQCFYDKFDNS